MNTLAQQLARKPGTAKKASTPLAPVWLWIALGVTVLLFLAYFNKAKFLAAIPNSLKPNLGTPLSEVVLGKWDVHAKDGNHFVVTFGRHSEMSVTMDVPAQYRAKLQLDQMWVGGNYHFSGSNVVEAKFTDGRFAVMMAQLRGLRFTYVQVTSYSQDEMTDREGSTWKRLGNAPAAASAEAHDLADEAPPAPSRQPGTAAAATPNAAEAANAKRLQAEHVKLTAMYAKLEKRRRTLNPKDPKALAAFNKDAADYAKQVAKLAAQANPASVVAIPANTAAASPAPTAASATPATAPSPATPTATGQ